MLVVWGVAHIAATRPVLTLYGELSTDNRRVRVMEWVAEGFTHVFVGLLVVVITAIEGAGESGATVVYRSCAAFAAGARGVDRRDGRPDAIHLVSHLPGRPERGRRAAARGQHRLVTVPVPYHGPA